MSTPPGLPPGCPPWFARPAARSWTCAPASAAGTRAFHAGLPGYSPTPLTEVPAIASELGVGRAFVKDESARMGLAAFKVLGASWAVHQVLSRQPAADQVTLVAATDGNHGRALAWMARLLGQRAHVFVPSGVHPAAVAAIAAEGAQVTEITGTYDDAVRLAVKAAGEPEAELVQDAGWPGYEQVPGWIVDGYSTLFAEVDQQLAADQAGQDASGRAGLRRQQRGPGRTRPAPVVGDTGLSQRPDARRDHHQGRAGRPGRRELLVDLGEQGRVAVDDPAWHLLVAGPAGVLDEFGLRFAGRLGSEPYRVVIAPGDLGDLRSLRRDGRHRRGVHAAGHEHVRPLPQEPGHPGQRPAVVAVGGGHQRDRAGRGPPGQHLVNGPGGTQHLERCQAHPGRLVLHERPADAELGRDGGYLSQRSGRVAGQPGVKGPCPGGGSRGAGPGPGGRPGEPRRAARRQARGSDHPPTMPYRHDGRAGRVSRSPRRCGGRPRGRWP